LAGNPEWLLFDGSSLIFRAFYGVPASMRSPDGRPVNAVRGFMDRLATLIVERRPGSEVRRAAEAEGLTSLRESALQKVFSGVSTLHEINRVTFVEEVNVGRK